VKARIFGIQLELGDGAIDHRNAMLGAIGLLGLSSGFKSLSHCPPHSLTDALKSINLTPLTVEVNAP
jgi:hypothetical protein